MPPGPLTQRRVLGRKTLPFVDRTELLSSFMEWHARLAQEETGVAIFHGLGGIGKTRLAQRVSEALGATCPSVRVDFYLPELRGFDSALMAIRRGLGQHLGRGAFPRFDLAYAHYWKLTHPGELGQGSEIPFLDESEILSDIVTSFADIPGIGAIIAAAKGASKVHSWLQRHSQLKDPLIAEIPGFDVHEIGRALPEYLGLDLAALPQDKPRPVIFIDTYEALASGPELVDGEAATSWLDSAIGTSAGTTWVITSRDPLGWESGESGDLRLVVLEQQVLPLDDADTMTLAAEGGAPSSEIAERIHALSQGVPFFVELALEYAASHPGLLESEDWSQRFPHDRLVSRFVGHLAPSDRDTLTLMSGVTRFDNRVLLSVQQFAGIPASLSTFSHLSNLTLCRRVGSDSLTLEPLVAPYLSARLAEVAPEDFNEFLAQMLADRSRSLVVDDAFVGRQWLVIEALRVAGLVGRVHPGLEEACDKLARSPALASTENSLRELIAAIPPDGHTAEPYWLATLTLARLRRRRGAFEQAEALLAHQRFPERLHAHAEWVLADVRREAGKPNLALTGYQRVVELAQEGHSDLIPAQLSIADRHMVLGQYQEALRTIEGIEAGLVNRGDTTDLALLLRQKGQLLRVAGSPSSTARAVFDESERLWGQLSDEYETARIWTDLADLLCLTRDPSAAEYAANAMSVHERLGEMVEYSKAVTHLAWAQWQQGDEAALTETLVVATEAHNIAHYQSGTDRFMILKAAIALAQGDTGAAEYYARAAAMSVESRDSHRSISLMGRFILRAAGVETPDDLRILERLLSEVEWLPDSQLDHSGFPHYYHALLGIV